MSRTYRCRRLPILPGTPRKLIGSFSHVRLGWVDRIEQRMRSGDTTYPVGHVIAHPWVSYNAAYAKRPYRIRGNRRVRRAARTQLRIWTIQGGEYEDPLPGKLYGWDIFELW